VKGDESKPDQFQTIAKGTFTIEISKLTQQALIFINRISIYLNPEQKRQLPKS
jgi:hypothetical protein